FVLSPRYLRLRKTNQHPRGSSVILFVLGLFIFSVQVSSAFAQQAATATLTGTVKDPNGAVVAGAQVTATQRATGSKRETTTNNDGLFVMTNLPADDYELQIQAAGFSIKTVNATLQVGQSATLNSS